MTDKEEWRQRGWKEGGKKERKEAKVIQGNLLWVENVSNGFAVM